MKEPPHETDELIEAFWKAFRERNWKGARSCLSDDAIMSWPCTGERFLGADSIIHVNSIYPEGWSIRLIECNHLLDGRVHTVIRVDHPPHNFFATSLFSTSGLIQQITEYWSTIEAPPHWRSSGNLPGYERISFTSP
ncbi:nuclear transport factor 2 family protein [Dongia soli]|uniref:nuclear transport factor 2 family protein n=1 Tax=Dongia soli TaxID=600628 RepID=UPI002A6AC3EC|nr:hypothetical protein [Dongia soli]